MISKRRIKIFLLSIILFFSLPNGYSQENDSIIYDFSEDFRSLNFPVFHDTIPVNPLFMPLVFSGKILPEDLKLYTPVTYAQKPAYIPAPDTVRLFEDRLLRDELNRKAYLYLIYNKPTAIKYSNRTLPKDIPITKEIKGDHLAIIFSTPQEIDFSVSGSPDIIPVKRRYWTANFETSLQFSQNHISENWYKGGNSNFNMQFINKLTHEYAKNKIKISTIAEYKLSLYTTTTDSLRSYRIGDDAFSIINSYGYQAFKNWYYSLSLDFRTQFFDNFYENRSDLKSSSLLSPMSLNVGLGMEYKLSKKFQSNKYRKIELSANVAPFSYNVKYLQDELVDKKRHGFLEDEDHVENFGSKIVSTIQFNFNRNISWNFKYYYFSNYENVEMEFENTINLAISKFFSTRIYCNVRFDDKVKKVEPEDSYFQFYETLTFGFNYRF
jgi:hypothetical protein